jgi:hypothetical protein
VRQSGKPEHFLPKLEGGPERQPGGDHVLDFWDRIPPHRLPPLVIAIRRITAMAIGLKPKGEIRAELDQLGVERVRLMYSKGEFSVLWNPTINDWLAEREQEEQRKKDAYNRSILWIAIAALFVTIVGVAAAWFH